MQTLKTLSTRLIATGDSFTSSIISVVVLVVAGTKLRCLRICIFKAFNEIRQNTVKAVAARESLVIYYKPKSEKKPQILSLALFLELLSSL